MAIKCNQNFVDYQVNERKKTFYAAGQRTNIEKAIDNLHQLYLNFKTKSHNTEAARQLQKQTYYDDLLKTRLGELHNLDGADYNKVESFMANRLAQRAKALGLSPDLKFSDAGEVGYDMLTVRRIARDLINDLASGAAAVKVRKLNDDLKVMFKHYGISNKHLQAQIMFDAAELGSIPKINAAYAIGAAGQAYNMERYNTFLNELRGYGFVQADIDLLVDNMHNITDTMDEIRLVATAMGVDIGNVKGIDYIMRVFTPEVKKYLDLATAKEKGGIDELIATGNLGGIKIGMASRNSYSYIPEYIEGLAYKLELDPNDLNRLLAEGTLPEFLHKTYSADQLDALVDEGLLSKLPMTTRETYNYIVKQYSELPVKGLADVFVSNPSQVIDVYSSYLKQAAEASAVSHVIVDEGVKQGWSIPSDVWKQMTDKPDNFVFQSPEAIQTFFPRYNGKGVWVHKYVADAWKAQMTIALDPGMLGTYAGHVNFWSTIFSRSALINGAYVPRIIWDSFRNVAAAGGNLLRLWEGYSDLMTFRRTGKNGFDNVNKVYLGMDGSMVTEQKFMEDVFRFRVGKTAPGTAVGTGNWKDILEVVKPENIANAMKYTKTYFEQFGGKEAAKYVAGMFSNTHRNVFAPIATAAEFFETGAKIATLKSLAYRGRGANKVGQWAAGIDYGSTFKNLEEIFRHVDNYFMPWDDIGTITKEVGTWVRPFASFAMMNPPAQIRQAMRRPREFINYWRIRSFIMGESDAKDKDINEATVPDWMMKSGAAGFWKTQEGQYFTLLSNAWDSRGDAWSFFTESGESLQRQLGWYEGTTTEQRRKIYDEFKGRSGIFEFFGEQINTMYTHWKLLAEYALGRDIETGKEIEKGNVLEQRKGFLGVEMPVVFKHLLESYPPLQRLDAWNPGNVFGTPEIRDPVTNELQVPESEGWLGGRRDDANRIENYIEFKNRRTYQVFKELGFNPKIIDVARGLQYSYSETKKITDEMSSAINKSRRELLEEQDQGLADTKEYNRRAQAINDTIDKWVQLRYDLDTIEVMMIEKNIKPKDAFSDTARRYYEQQLKYGRPAPGDKKIVETMRTFDKLYVPLRK